MKKYIRTKDDRLYEVFGVSRVMEGVYQIYGYPKYIKMNDVVKQSDILQELCDEFVSIFKDNDKFIETDFQMSQDRFTGLKGIRKPTACYGAIWTDKGLIYVAKMNDKGELKLL